MRKFYFITLVIIVFTYRLWFDIVKTLSSGDWPYLYLENIKEFSFFPDPHNLWLSLYYQIPTKLLVEYIHIPWELTEKILWFWPFLILSILSAYSLFRSWISVLIYTTNTYILMIVGGGQMGVALSYAFAPFILKSFIHLIDCFFQKRNANKYIIMSGFSLALGLMFDPRITYIVTIAGIFYLLLFIFFNSQRSDKKLILSFGIMFLLPFFIAITLNLFWIVPIMLNGFPGNGEGLKSIEGFKYFSFSDFSHSLSLLHPNWPENIFGKVYFMQSEFILLPIIAYSSLLFLSSKTLKTAEQNAENRKILFFAICGILGSFLAKGVNEPFGFINQWLFSNFPGMNLFRDSTKFYILIALSYSFLIPATLKYLSFDIKKIKVVTLIMFIIVWSFLIRDAILGKLDGTFKPHSVPPEYFVLKDFFISRPVSKTLWIPAKQRFGFSSKKHVAINTEEFIGVTHALGISAMLDEEFFTKLKQQRINYVILPFDTHKELFVQDRTYNQKIRDKLENRLNKIKQLRRISEFKEIALYMVQSN